LSGLKKFFFERSEFRSPLTSSEKIVLDIDEIITREAVA
jgi:hypothetical protein